MNSNCSALFTETSISSPSSTPPADEDSIFCRPKLLSGHDRVAIGWRKSIDSYIHKIDTSSSNRVLGVMLQTSTLPVCFFFIYLPTCSDAFKESLDYLDSLIGLFGYENNVVILSDINAEPGPAGGTMATSPPSEQGRILVQYLGSFLYAHLHLSPSSATSTYESEAHRSTYINKWSPWHRCQGGTGIPRWQPVEN